MHMQKMKLFALLALTCVYVCTDAITGDSFSSYYGYGWTSTTLDCNDFVPCTVNCWGGASCVSVSINGPKNSSLTINCDSEFGGGGTNGVSSCIQMSIYAENSTSLTINVYNEDYGFKNNFVYTPNTNNPLVANTFITCGLIEDHNPSTPTTYSCGAQNNIYSIHGWQTVEWSYAAAASWSLDLEPSIDFNTMRCGSDYLDSCEFDVDGFYYRCVDTASACDYDRSSQPQSHTAQPTTYPTASPTNLGDLPATYTTDTTLGPSMTYNVVSDVLIDWNTVLTVSGGVDIVFKDDYTIFVQGTINVGCDTIDTLNNHEIGIMSESQLISIYNEDDSTFKGRIHIHDRGSAFFCNTRFTNLYRIYYYGGYSANSLLVDNCEFDHLAVGIEFYKDCDYITEYITDNKFMNSNGGIKNARCVNVENNIFESTSSPMSCPHASIINNNTFVWDQTGYRTAVTACGGNRPPNITFNTFSHWEQAISIDGNYGDQVNVLYNEFIDNTKAIFIESPDPHHIKYNNFISNSYSIYNGDCGHSTIRWESCSQTHCGYNYYGASSIDQSIISSQIYDICDGGEGHGLVTWWPWYTEPIDFNSLPTTLQEHTFEILDCIAGDAHSAINGNKLPPLYPYDTTLTASNSPYYIVSLVRTPADTTIYVESGVELIFAGNYDIRISGAWIMGCHAVDTVNNHTIGIISNAESISASSIDTTKQGRIIIESDGSGSFCNTKFENMQSAIYRSRQSPNNLLIDNCEFYTNLYGVQMTDTGDDQNDYASTQ
eukprot:888464_1